MPNGAHCQSIIVGHVALVLLYIHLVLCSFLRILGGGTRCAGKNAGIIAS